MSGRKIDLAVPVTGRQVLDVIESERAFSIICLGGEGGSLLCDGIARGLEFKVVHFVLDCFLCFSCFLFLSIHITD